MSKRRQNDDGDAPAKTARFGELVKVAGKPEPYTLWTDPKDDKTFQAALKTNRVMSVHQANVGASADFGTVGFVAGLEGVLLVFPKSIKRFSDRHIVGVKYELLDTLKTEPKGKRERAEKRKIPERAKKPKARPPAMKERKERAAPKPRVKPTPEPKKVEPKPGKALPLEKLISGIKQAMRALDAGNAVRAYKVLAGLVE